MPTFDLDLDVDDIIDEMSSWEKEEMYEALKEELCKEEFLLLSIKNIKLNISSNPSSYGRRAFKSFIKYF